MSTFFENQIKARKRTKLLLALYFLAVIIIIISIYFVAIFAQNETLSVAAPATRGVIKRGSTALWQPEIFILVTGSVSLVIFLASFFKILQLGGAGSKVAEMLGGQLINPATTNPDERKILNVVEEIAIASGLHVPPVYVMNQEVSINAFAAGSNHNNAVIGVSRGCIELLSRDELQGVVAHEFSHILHGDTALNLRLIGILHGILFIALTGRFMMEVGFRSSRFSSRSSKSNGGMAAFGIVGLSLLIIGYTGVFFANLIKMAVSRQREFLADASAVQYTRNPHGIAGALKKIGSLSFGSKIDNQHAEEASHLFFSDGIRKSLSGLFATHPPLIDRIKVLDPGFDGVFPQISYEQLYTDSHDANTSETKQHANRHDSLKTILNNPVGHILGSVGTVGLANIEAAQNFMQSLPPKINEAVHDPFSAALMIYLILLDDRPEIRAKQLKIIENHIPTNSFAEFSKLIISRQEVQKEDLLTILDLSLPTLNFLSQSQYQQLIDLARLLIQADKNVDLYEYTLQVILKNHFEQKFFPERINKSSGQSLSNLIQPASDLFLALAVISSNNDLSLAEAAYQAAADHCALPASKRYNFQELPAIGLTLFDQSIEAFRGADYQIKEVMLRACISCISRDQEISKSDLALIRAIAESFGCPVPYLG